MASPPQLTVPEWEIPRSSKSGGKSQALRWPERSRKEANRDETSWRAIFDSIMPANGSFFGLPRRKMLIVIAVCLLSVLAVVIGLGVGLTRKTSVEDLPLPSSSETFTGDLTYYGTGLGACGIDVKDTDMIVSISHIVYDAAQTGSNPNANPLCGLMIRASRFDEAVNKQRSVDLRVVDRCTGCRETDLDLSPAAFEKLADPNLGRVTVQWAWL